MISLPLTGLLLVAVLLLVAWSDSMSTRDMSEAQCDDQEAVAP